MFDVFRFAERIASKKISSSVTKSKSHFVNIVNGVYNIYYAVIFCSLWLPIACKIMSDACGLCVG